MFARAANLLSPVSWSTRELGPALLEDTRC